MVGELAAVLAQERLGYLLPPFTRRPEWWNLAVVKERWDCWGLCRHCQPLVVGQGPESWPWCQRMVCRRRPFVGHPADEEGSAPSSIPCEASTQWRWQRWRQWTAPKNVCISGLFCYIACWLTFFFIQPPCIQLGSSLSLHPYPLNCRIRKWLIP